MLILASDTGMLLVHTKHVQGAQVLHYLDIGYVYMCPTGWGTSRPSITDSRDFWVVPWLLWFDNPDLGWHTLPMPQYLGPLHTRVIAVTNKLWEPKRKRPKAVPRHFQNRVAWSRILMCIVKSYVTGPPTKCWFNEFLFMWVLTHYKIE